MRIHRVRFVRRRHVGALIVLASAALCACGGGGDSGTPAFANPTSYLLRTGYSALLTSGLSRQLTVSGDCTGTASLVARPASAVTFEGTSGVASSATLTVSFTNCSGSGSATATTYYDANDTEIGAISTDGEYGVLTTTAVAFPTSVRVGDSASLGTITKYSDSTKGTIVGREDLSYVIETDTATTAVADFVTASYDPANSLVVTERDRYRIAADGSLTLLSIDVQYPSSLHLILTAN